MRRIRLYRNSDCARCARIAKIDALLDWFGRVEFSTDVAPSGPLRLGEIVVEDLATSHIARGSEAFQLLCRHIPAYAPLRLLLFSKRFRRFIDRQLNGEVPCQCD